MKKSILLSLMLTMSLFAFAGCAKEEAPVSNDPVVEQPAAEEPKTEEPVAGEVEVTEDSVKTGLAVISSVEKSADAGEKDGLAQTDSVVLAVTVDQDGKIVKAAIDTAQTKINFTKEGKIASDKEAEYKSKQELGADYGMTKASSIGKEWFEQANALADYMVGKTVEEIKAIPVTDTGVPTEADLTSSVTIKINGYVAAVEKAVENAEFLGATKNDELGLGVVTTISKSKDAAADAEGVAQAYSTFTVTTFDADGKITSSIIDASQSNVKFDTTGKITTDLAADVLTKNELGDNYGMKKASKIGKEWYEQAKAFADFVVGKTAEEVTAIAVDAEGTTTDADLVSSVTIGIDAFQNIVAKAAASAK
ncbi:hypothetical protein [Sedimentibacter sp. B4]|uniref:hypothetical protein n=1 Tax=Sedimentibacter sp. B4 TaxID=304766 RepID=UPI00030103B7|nr:hypothetical protein [Sedimentibacter sp. B4]